MSKREREIREGKSTESQSRAFKEIQEVGWSYERQTPPPPLFLHLTPPFLLPLPPPCRIVNVSLPKKTRNNGTLYAIVFVHQAGVTPWQDPKQVHLVAQLTTYMVPKPPEVSLIAAEDDDADAGGDDDNAKVS